MFCGLPLALLFSRTSNPAAGVRLVSWCLASASPYCPIPGLALGRPRDGYGLPDFMRQQPVGVNVNCKQIISEECFRRQRRIQGVRGLALASRGVPD